MPIVYKLFTTLVGGIGVVIIILLGYLWGHESDLMLKKEEDILHTRSIAAANDLNAHMIALHKELLFLSRLEVMNDMVTLDMDRRITSILKQKTDDLGESIVLYTIAPDFTVPAASESPRIATHSKEGDTIADAVRQKRSHLFLGDNLYFFTPIYGSFYTHDILGYLVMAYPLKNFKERLKTDENLYRWLTPPLSPSLSYQRDHPVFDEDAYLHDTIPLAGILKGWALHYAMPKNQALALLYHVQTLFLWGFGVGLALIAFLVWIILLQIIKPLRALSDTARTIAITGDYTQTVVQSGTDEVGMMAHSFNALMSTTRATMERLEEERKKHWDTLVSLIVFFNAITRTDTKESTIEIAMYEIRRFSNAKEVYFSEYRSEIDGVTLALDAVGNETPGVICIIEPELAQESNERFYAALERMLALQMERIELLGKTQAALTAKSAFLSAMSHELRTPLGSILSLTQYLIIHPSTPEPICETLGKIENSAYHLLGVINNILDLAKAESGKMEPHTAPCDPVALIKDAIELVYPLAEEKKLTISTTLEPFEGEFLSDSRLFGQVVINLLSNAIKYTAFGSIHVTLRSGEGVFVLEVKDSGRGIAQDALGHIFDEFYRARSTEQESSEGSGLGLALSKQIALLLRGDLFITSEGEGKGTTASFHFRTF